MSLGQRNPVSVSGPLQNLIGVSDDRFHWLAIHPDHSCALSVSKLTQFTQLQAQAKRSESKLIFV